MSKKYYKRILDDVIEKRLNMVGAILIQGPKWCGKTTTARQHANSILELQDPDQSQKYMDVAEIRPSRLLEGEKPRLIDEWQVLPVLWDSVRTHVDRSDVYGQYILTGSTIVDESKIMHSGTGRINRITMLPMSLYESKESNGKISILELFENPDTDIDDVESDLSFEDLAFATCRGGWPESVIQGDEESKLFVVKNYVENICQNDMSSVDGVKRSPNRVKAVLRSYARNTSTEATKKTILNDLLQNYPNMTYNTLDSYIEALSKLFVIVNIPAWNPNIRSKTAMKSSDKRQFIDPSIAAALLNVNHEGLIFDLETFGLIFENLCIRDLLAYTSYNGGHVSYYRDRYGLEADCVLHLENEDYALIEFKLGRRRIEEGCQNLIKLNGLIEKAIEEKGLKIKKPKFLAVITGWGCAYTRKDGVKIIPISCLR